MYYQIENAFLSAQINGMGAELHALTDRRSGYEYLWQGNPDIWYGQAPVLFPVIGRLLNDKYRYNGREYTLAKHGFARKSAFEPVRVEGDTAEFLLRENEKTLEMYPFRFALYVKFALDGRSLKATHTVVNKNDGEMFFSIGGHPGFNCAIGDYLEFDENETLSTETIDGDSLRLPDKSPVLNGEKRITLTKRLFDNDALILSGIRSKAVTLKSDQRPQTVRFTFGDAPFLGIWAKPGAPYVCIEPWCGVNDDRDEKDDISKKEGIVRLGAGETFALTYTAEVN